MPLSFGATVGAKVSGLSVVLPDMRFQPVLPFESSERAEAARKSAICASSYSRMEKVANLICHTATHLRINLLRKIGIDLRRRRRLHHCELRSPKNRIVTANWLAFCRRQWARWFVLLCLLSGTARSSEFASGCVRNSCYTLFCTAMKLI